MDLRAYGIYRSHVLCLSRVTATLDSRQTTETFRAGKSRKIKSAGYGAAYWNA